MTVNTWHITSSGSSNTKGWGKQNVKRSFMSLKLRFGGSNWGWSKQTQTNFLLTFTTGDSVPCVLLQTEPIRALPIIEFCTQCARGYLGPFEQGKPLLLQKWLHRGRELLGKRMRARHSAWRVKRRKFEHWQSVQWGMLFILGRPSPLSHQSEPGSVTWWHYCTFCCVCGGIEGRLVMIAEPVYMERKIR